MAVYTLCNGGVYGRTSMTKVVYTRRVTSLQRSPGACCAYGTASRSMPGPGTFPSVGQVGTGIGDWSGEPTTQVDASPGVGWSGAPEITALEARGPITGAPVHRYTGWLTLHLGCPDSHPLEVNASPRIG